MRLLYLDECHLPTHPDLATCWQRPGASAPGRPDQRLTVVGALEYRSGQLATTLEPAASSARFEQFLTDLAARWPDDQLVLVLDNASYHRSPAVRSWLAAQHERITLLWLPTSSPQLNLIERVWRFVKSKLACHRDGNDLPGLTTFAPDILDRPRATFAAPTRPHLFLCQSHCESA